jgi:uncharacterized repeat protein (TIGR01451 family)
VPTGRGVRASVAFLAAIVVTTALAAPPAGAAGRNADRVTLCHRVGGPQYVQITIAPAAVLSAHARNHDLDIIPPFRTGSTSFPGQNWDADGKLTWSNGCVPPPSPQPIRVFVGCVDRTAGTTYTARFGYKSDNTVVREVPVGADNAVQPGGPGRGQPTTFLPGRDEKAFRVEGVPAGESVTWTLRFAGQTSTATADASSPPCETAPLPNSRLGVFATCVDVGADGRYDATFGFQNDAPVDLTVPIGADNAVAPGGPDRGQPSVFPPGRSERAFTVRGIPADQKATWTIDKGGSERIAVATASSKPCTDPPEEAKSIGIFVACVSGIEDGTYSARFGYENANKGAIEIPLGLRNRFSPEPAGRGQPTVFQPGKVREAFTVAKIPADDVLVWTLAFQGTRTATASAAFPTRCESPPPPEVKRVAVFLTCVQAEPGGTYAASFGYENPSAEVLERAVGEQNGFSPAPVGRGQPTAFRPGTVNRAFTVKGIPRAERPEWRLTSRDGTVSVARATPFAPQCVTQPPPGPDLDVEKRAVERVVRVGAPVRFTLVVTNPGSASSWGITLRDRLPAGLRFVAVRADRRSVRCRAGRPVECRTARLAPGAQIIVSVVARAVEAGRLLNEGDLGGSGTPSRPVDRDRAQAAVVAQPRPAPRPSFTG